MRGRQGRSLPLCFQLLLLLCPVFIVLSTEYFQFHIVFISAFLDLWVFPQNEGHTANREQEGSNVPPCQTPPWAQPKPLMQLCQRQRAIGPAPAAQSPLTMHSRYHGNHALCSVEATGHHGRCHHQQTHAFFLSSACPDSASEATRPGHAPPRAISQTEAQSQSEREASFPVTLPHPERALHTGWIPLPRGGREPIRCCSATRRISASKRKLEKCQHFLLAL